LAAIAHDQLTGLAWPGLGRLELFGTEFTESSARRRAGRQRPQAAAALFGRPGPDRLVPRYPGNIGM